MEDKITVGTPFGPKVDIFIIPTSERRQLEKVSTKLLIQEINTMLGPIPIYKLAEGTYVIFQTEDDFALRVKNIQDLQLIIRNEFHDILSLLKDKGKLYPGFTMSSFGIAKLLDRKKIDIPGYKSRISNQQQTIFLDDNSILRYYERGPGVYAGSWFESKECFDFFYFNSFVS